MKRAYGAGCSIEFLINEAELIARQERGGIAYARIIRDGAPELRRAGFIGVDLAHQVQLGDGVISLLPRHNWQVPEDPRHQPHDLRSAAVNHHEFRNGHAGTIGPKRGR